jgi:hypothetical protein
MCASPAAMSCGGCSGFTYCGVGCLSLHWREFGHDTQCGRIKPDVDARDAIRVAHDVQKLAWWQAAVVDTDEGRATACDALGSCHGKGVFRRECGCFRDVLFGTLPLDTLDASEFGVDTVDTAWFELGESNTLDRGVVSNAMSQYPTTWLELYETLGLPTTSRAALVLSTGATVLYAANVLGVLSGGQGVVSHGNGGEEGGGPYRPYRANRDWSYQHTPNSNQKTTLRGPRDRRGEGAGPGVCALVVFRKHGREVRTERPGSSLRTRGSRGVGVSPRKGDTFAFPRY